MTAKPDPSRMVQELHASQDRRVTISASVRPGTLRRLDTMRGSITRSRMIAAILEHYMSMLDELDS